MTEFPPQIILATATATEAKGEVVLRLVNHQRLPPSGRSDADCRVTRARGQDRNRFMLGVIRLSDASITFDADAYWQAGQIPWTIFAFPASLADSQRLPPDDDARRFLVALQSLGMRVGIWSHPDVKDTIYFACPFEDRMMIQSAIEDFERQGTFPPGFSVQRTEQLFSLVVRN